MSVLQATFAATLVDEWVRAGVTDAVVCPGSRSTPLALALADRVGDGALRLHVRLDERGAGFFAIGLALASGRPPVVCVTSGTAAAELHPAVVEAHHARVPLLVCTADRPPELQDVGAPQTIDQADLYGRAVRWSVQPGVVEAETSGTWRSLAARAVAAATSSPAGPGPVHLDLAFREPLVDRPGPLPPGREGGAPYHRVRRSAGAGAPDPDAAAALAASFGGRRGVVVAGAGCGDPTSVLAFAASLGWPVLPDPRSGCRLRHPCVVAAADALARVAPGSLRPEVVVRLGAAWASKALPAFLAGVEAVAVDPWWRWADPERATSEVWACEPTAFCDALADAAGAGATGATGAGGATAGDWLSRWQAAEEAAREAIDAALCDGTLSEPALARRLFSMVPPAATLVVSSSMPVRDLEWFAPVTPGPPRVLANRGANGIDGVCSTALGVAAAGSGPVVAVVGDLAFFHDVSSLAASAATARAGSCTVVVVDNGGGGIFELLPQATVLGRGSFDLLFGTPQAPDVVAVSRGFGLPTEDAGSMDELAGALGRLVGTSGLSLVRARVPQRPANAAVHERVHAAVARRVAAALDGPRGG